ncbi:MAG: porin [Geminicoccaceae bacterium]
MAALALAPALFLPTHSLQAGTAATTPAKPKLSTSVTAPIILPAQSRSDEQADVAGLDVRYGRHDEYDRFAFEWSEPVEVDFSKSGGELVLTFDRAKQAELPPNNDFAYLADSLPQLVFGMRVEDGGRRYRVDIDRKARFRIHRWNDGRLIVLDVFQPTPSDTPGAAASVGVAPEPAAPVSDLEPEQVVTDEPSIETAETAPVTEDDSDIDDGREGPDEADVEEVMQDVDDDVESVEADEEDEEGVDDETYDEDDEDEDDEPANDFWTAGAFDIELGGSLEFGISTAEGDRLSDGEGDRGYTFLNDSEITIEAFTTIFDEVDVGAALTLEADADVGGDTANADDAYIYVDNGFGQVQIGRTTGAEDDMALGADTIAAGTGGIDGDTANLGDTQVETSGDAAKISYFTPRIAGFQAGLSYTPDTGDEEDDDDDNFDLENHVGVGLNFVETFGEVEFSLATVGSFGRSEFSSDDDLSGYALGGTLIYDAVQFGASYGQSASDFDVDFATFGVTFGFGEMSAGVGYNFVDESDDGQTHVLALSGNTPILPGVELQGDVSIADPENDDGNVASVLAVEFGF